MLTQRHAVPLIAGLVVFGAVTAFAAGFSVSSTTIQSGSATVGGCGAIAAVTYNMAWDAGLSAYKVSTAPVTTGAGCKGMSYKVTVTNAGNVALGEISGTLDSVTGAASPDFAT
ncbi:MAG TPA: hypothetical protein VGH31_05055, partial [Acidimicrobiales bacterium]